MTAATALAAIVGDANVARPGEGRDHLLRDIFFDEGQAAFIVRPRSRDEVAAVVALAAAEGLAVFPRGGGMSYTRAYIPSVAASILLDLSALNAIVAIDPDNMFVTVEPGVTWQQLYETLKPLGLRLPVFGTISGAAATAGGGLSQGAIFHGSTQYGTMSDHVLGLEVVLADGSRVRTGQAAMRNGKPFFRWHGPDLTGPFLGDAGALGIKIEMTFRLIRWPDHMIPLSFAFDSFEAMWLAQNAIARAGIAADCFCFDAAAQHQMMERTSLVEDAAALAQVVRNSGGLFKGLKAAARIATGGKGFLESAAHSLHVVVEHRHAEAAAAMAREVASIAEAEGGRPLPDTVPRVTRATPFGSMDQTLGPAGERWVPVHGLFALSDGLDAMTRLRALLDRHADAMAEHKVLPAILSNAVGASAMIIEVLFYWPDAPHPLHQQIVSPEKFARALRHPANPAGRALVGDLRSAILDCFANLGSAPFGIGKTIPYRANRDPESYALLERVKTALDPSCRMNPGALGLQ
ncbi:MAG: FAD-binding oxidoreductase [Pseudomonadota bacterium]